MMDAVLLVVAVLFGGILYAIIYATVRELWGDEDYTEYTPRI